MPEMSELEEATAFIYTIYPKYRGVKLSEEVLIALLKGYLSEVADQQHSAAVRAGEKAAQPYAEPTSAHTHVWVGDHWEAHHVRIA